MYGPELSFAYKWLAQHPNDTLAMVKCGIGGTGIEQWLPYDATTNPYGGTCWPRLQLQLAQAKARLDASGVPYEWAGLLWMQGETVALDVYDVVHNPTIFTDKTRQFLSLVRGLTRADLPCVVGRIGDQMLNDDVVLPLVNANQTADQLRAGVNNRRANQVAVGGDPNNIWVDTDGLPRNLTDIPANRYHFTGAGYMAMGERFYAKWQELIGEVPPPPPTPLLVRFNGSPENWTVKLNGVAVGGNNDVIDVAG